MSILINGMKMPNSCDMCWALDDYGDYPRCRITEEQRGYNFRIREKRMDNCPLVPVPSHGRLIDADKMERDMSSTVQGDIRSYPYSDTLWDMAFRWIDHQSTIIEAEEEE